MSVLNKKLVRDFLGSKLQTATVVSIITLGIGCMVGMYQTYNNLEQSMIKYYSQCNMADFWVTLKKAPDYTINSISNIIGISEVKSRILFPVIVDIESAGRPISGTLVSMPPVPDKNTINGIVIRRGSYFTNNTINQVIISEKFSEARKIYPGDSLDLIMNGIKKRLYVVGTANGSEFIYMTPPGAMAPDPANYGIFWVKNELAEDVYKFYGSFNSLTGKLSLGYGVNPEAIIDKIENLLGTYGIFNVTTLANQSSNMTLVAELSGLKMMAVIMPVIFLGLAVMVLNIIMIRMAEQQRTIIGTLKALGYSDRNILFYNLNFGAIVGLAGGVIGVVIGYFFAGAMTNIYQNLFTFPNLENHLSIKISIFAVLLSLTFAVLGAAKGASGMIRMSPAEAMRPAPPQTTGKIKFDKLGIVWNKLGFIWQYVIRSVFRNPFRSFAGFVCSVIGAAIIVMSLGMMNALDYMMFFQYTLTDKSDYSLTFNRDVSLSVVNELMDMPGVYEVSPEFHLACNLINGRFSKKNVIIGLQPEKTQIKAYSIDGKEVPIPKSGILLCKRMAEKLHIKPGDTISIVPVKGYQNPIKVQVADIFDTTFGLPIYADFNYLNKISSQGSSVSALQIKAQQTEKQKAEFLKELKKFPLLESVSVTAEARAEMESGFIQQMKGMVYSLIFFAAIIFFSSILNSSLIAVSERKVEIATFKAFGYHNSEIGKIFLREILLVNVPGIIFGLPVGYLFLFGMCKSYKNDMYSMPAYIYNSTWVITIVLSFIFVLCAFYVTKRTIDKLLWQDALKIKE